MCPRGCPPPAEPEAAAKGLQRQAELGYERPAALYNAACAQARAQDKRRALELLDAAVRNGFADSELMAKDSDLDSVRSIAFFQELAQRAGAVGELRTELARLEQERKAEQFLALHGELAALLIGDGRLQAEHGTLALKAGDARGAALAFGRQIEAGFDVPMAHYRRACARARGGDSEGALGDLGAAVEQRLGYDGIAQDAGLDSLRTLPGFAELQTRLVTRATSGRELRTLLVSENAADMPALAALVADESQSKRFRGAAALALGRLQLARASWGEAHATFERAADLGAEVSLSAFGMAEALAGGGRKAQALRHVQLALDLGYANKDALGQLLERSELASPAEAEELLARAEKAQALSQKAYPAERGKAWAAGRKGTKVAAE